MTRETIVTLTISKEKVHGQLGLHNDVLPLDYCDQ